MKSLFFRSPWLISGVIMSGFAIIVSIIRNVSIVDLFFLLRYRDLTLIFLILGVLCFVKFFVLCYNFTRLKRFGRLFLAKITNIQVYPMAQYGFLGKCVVVECVYENEGGVLCVAKSRFLLLSPPIDKKNLVAHVYVALNSGKYEVDVMLNVK